MAAAGQLPLNSRSLAVPQKGQGAPRDPGEEDWGWVELQRPGSMAQGETLQSYSRLSESLCTALVESTHPATTRLEDPGTKVA